MSTLSPAIIAAAEPGGPTLERLWQLSNYDPIFYRRLVAAAGYTKAAWQAIDAPPMPIEPWIAPRPIPAYIGVSSSVGLDESEVNGEFGPNAGSSF
jgi:hypothetical protein